MQKVIPPDANASAQVAHARVIGPLPAIGGPFPRTPEPTGASIHTGRPTKAGKIGLAAPKSLAPDKVLQSFNTWAFKREQPDNPRLLLQLIETTMQAGRPLPFVLYWGKGPRRAIAEPDVACLDYLAAMARRVGDAYAPGAAIKLIFTDTHAGLNGHDGAATRDYFAAIEEAAHERGFTGCWLGGLVDAARAAGDADGIDASVPADTLQRLGVCAAKWFRGEGSPEAAAATYYQMNMIEKRAVQRAFPASIFVTFNGSEFRSLFPDRLPIFYMYSLKRGVGVKPWFLPAASADTVSS